MKMKKLISTALTVIMLFSAIAAVIPVSAGAAHSPSTVVSESTLTLDEIIDYVDNTYLKSNYNTAEEMLQAELDRGYLDHVTTANGLYTMYVNRYTGFLFYRNNYTGQILTSNPVNPYYNENKEADVIMSQIFINFKNASDNKPDSYNSIKWAARYGQISVTPISGGLRVNYTLGDTATRFLLPGQITADRFEERILGVMISSYEALIAELCPDQKPMTFLLNEDGTRKEESYELGYINNEALRNFINRAKTRVSRYSKADAEAIKKFNDFSTDLTKVAEAYTIQNPKEFEGNEMYAEMLEEMYKRYPVTQTKGIAIYSCKYDHLSPSAKKREIANLIKQYCPEYTMQMMYEDEAECEYVPVIEQKPIIRCALEYTFNDDGSLSVRLPASSISFDETLYTLVTITPLKYFGYGEMDTDGFIFMPDGSGTIVEFKNFANKSLALSGDVFGQDYCYATVTGQHREQISMPVFGLVTESNLNATTAEALKYYNTSLTKFKTGFFAIIEEGAALAEIFLESSGSAHKFSGVYASYMPYPQDEFDLSETLSVGNAGVLTMVSESKYTGSYVTRYKMLTDEKVGKHLFGEGNFYNTTYAGMAEYYRNYLKADGTLSALKLESEDLPLYIETLGSMTITSKFLTFPVEESIALTSFADVLSMYKEISNCKAHINSLIKDCEAKLLDEEVSDDEKINIEKDLEKYKDLITKVDTVRNINFRLTGYANDGMYFTYPNKVSWEPACGGDEGFEHLIAESTRISKTKGINFGVYPEFDFMYINNSTMFDGISERKTVSRMVDNRYASKQVYNSVLQEFESFFTMVISSDALDGLYSDFLEDYAEFDTKGLSVSTLGSDINSNFDEDNPINRDQSRENIIALLDRMANKDGYDVMIDKGNIYAVKYAKHILNVATDSSHFADTSYAVPFVGMILHGHVNYAGSPLNYSGSPNYEVLRSIENGAAPYYILCYANTAHMKDDEDLNQYYGVNYNSWYDELLLTYTELNRQIGDLQTYEIVDHSTLITERTVTESEKALMYTNLENEFFALLEAEIAAKLDAKFDSLKESGKLDARVKLDFDVESISAQFKFILVPVDVELDEASFSKKLADLVAKYSLEYPGAEDELLNEVIEISAVEDYKSEYKYSTKSDALSENYETTEFTLDTGKVVIVTYKNADGDTVRFVLNFNIYSVDVNIDGQKFSLGKYEYKRLED